MTTQSSLEDQALAIEADRCVKCALCLPHCPTYALSHNEADSPRGRISLIQSLLENPRQRDNHSVRNHLDKCLDCRACEAVCPAGVKYGRLIDGARNHLLPRSRVGHSSLIRVAVQYPKLFHGACAIARTIFSATFLRRRYPEYYQYLKQLSPPQHLSDQPSQYKRQVALFHGCIGKSFDGIATMAVHQLLTSSGYKVDVPRGQRCCGALAYHSGDTKTARRLAMRNIEALRNHESIVSCASGCSAHLAEYGTFSQAGREFASSIKDAPDLIAEALEAGDLSSKTDAPMRVALHVPCTARNVLRSDGARRCLKALPGIEIIELPRGCCGAAGNYFLDFPNDSKQLRLQHLAAIREAQADCVVTSNVGCRLHLQAGLASSATHANVIHIAELVLSRVRPVGRKIEQ